MNPVSKFDEISYEVLKKYEEDTVVTIGILVADCQQDEAKQYIINYMDIFDNNSGKYIDFYIPGYYEKFTRTNNEMSKKYHPNSCVRCADENEKPAFYLRRNDTPYYFDKFLFDDFIKEMKERMGINYTYNPMLLLVEVNKKKNRAQIEFQDKLVIELDEDINRGIRRAGQLFDKIFDEAKKTVNLNRFSAKVRMYFIKGKAVKNMIKVLDGEWIEPTVDMLRDVYYYRIKSH